MRTAAELKSEATEAISDSNVDHWLTVYRLREKVRCTPDVVSSLKSPQEGRLLFTSYVGAVFAQCGMVTVQEWISKLIDPPPLNKPNDPDPFSKRVKNEPPPIGIPSPPLSSPAYALHQAHYNPSGTPSYSQIPPQPAQPPPPLPNTPQNQAISFLPMFNQTANQRRLGVEYQAQFFGPPHAGRWTVKCMVNGLEKGQGMGSSKQLAKEEAARQAFYAMGWAAS
jgi:dsRNA-specific ribonuclease